MGNSLNPLSDNSGINELSNRLKNITTSNNISVQAATDSTSNVSSRLTLKVPVHLLQTLDFNPLHLMPF